MDFKVTPVFQKFWDIFKSRKYRQIVLYGGTRSSKTYSLMQGMVMELLTRKGIRITVWRNEKVTCRGTVMEDFADIINSNTMLSSVFIENKAKGTFTNKLNGSKIIFEGADSPGKVLGMKQTISIFNEITEFSEPVYLQITQRTEETIFADFNPSKKFWFDRMKLRKDTVFIHSDFRDNPFLSENIISQIKAYEPWESDSYYLDKGVPMYNGSRITKENQPPKHVENTKEKTANEYMWLVYGLGVGAEKPNKIYSGWEVMPRIEYMSLPYEEYYGLDFGTASPTACVGVKFDGDKTFYIDQKLYRPQSSSTKELHEVLPSAGITKDMSGVGDSAKMASIEKLRKEGFRIVPAKKGSGSVNAGIEVIQGFNIIYTNTSADLHEEYIGYSWEVDRYNKPTDRPIKMDDHLMDASRYIIHFLYYYLGIAARRDKEKAEAPS